jgi:selenocysteine-specific elongation factor
MHVIGTAGHVDHGKSTLVERLTGIDPDRWAEEKRRGLTIDLGFAWLTLPSGREVGIVDVPGHERFIKNMLAGAGGISICLFVVAANEGWMPQSAEHLGALQVLGVAHGVVAVTKADSVDAGTLQFAIDDVHEHLAGTTLEGVAVVPVSAATGEGIDELLTALDEAVTGAPVPLDVGRPRLWIDRAFTISGAGTVVTGTLVGGCLQTGESVEILGRTRRRRQNRARIRTIQSHKKQATEIGPGNRVALNLAGLARSDAARGDAVVNAGGWRVTNLVDARVVVLGEALSGFRHELTEKGSHLFYAGSAETPVRIKLFQVRQVGPGEGAYGQLSLRSPLPLARGDRFVLRDAGRVATIGGGEVLDPLPDRVRRNDIAHIELLRRLDGTDPVAALRALVESNGSMSMVDGLMRSGASAAGEGVVALGSLLVADVQLSTLMESVTSRLAAHHAARPLERGMPYEALRIETGLDPDSFEALLEKMNEVVTEGPVVRLATHRVALSDEQRLERDRLMKLIDDGAFSPPLASELHAESPVLRALVESGELIRVANFYLTSSRAQQARSMVRSHIEEHGPTTVAGIRDLLGTTRKYAVPLCEWLDQTGATRRRGDERVLGPNP